jgi:hypothetical protein
MKSDVYLASPVTLRGPSMRGVSRPIGEVVDVSVMYYSFACFALKVRFTW